MRNNNGFALIHVFFVVLSLVGFGGWVANIVKLIDSGFAVASWGGMEVARVVGIFIAPLGSVLGFF